MDRRRLKMGIGGYGNERYRRLKTEVGNFVMEVEENEEGGERYGNKGTGIGSQNETEILFIVPFSYK